MITITITSMSVTIENESGRRTEHTFHSGVRAQHFLTGLYSLLPFLGVDYKIVDERR